MRQKGIVILLAVLLCICIVPGCTEEGNDDDNGGDQNSVEGVIGLYLKYWEEGNIEKVVDLIYLPPVEGLKENATQDLTAVIEAQNEEITIDSWEVKEKESYGQENITKYMDMIEEEFNVTISITEAYFVNIEWTGTLNGTPKTDSTSIPVVKVNGKWYVDLFMTWADSSSGTTTPVGMFQKVEKHPAEGYVKVKFAQMDPSTPPTECGLSIDYQGSNTTLWSVSGNFVKNEDDDDVFKVMLFNEDGWKVKYQDLADDGVINPGDYMTLCWYNATSGNTWYPASGNYEIELTTNMGQDTICSVEFTI